MATSDELRQALATRFNLDLKDILLDDGGATINGQALGDAAVNPFLTKIDTCQIEVRDQTYAKISNGGKLVELRRVLLRSCQEKGLIEVEQGKTWLFVGSFGQISTNIDLSACLEIILALVVFDPDQTHTPERDWASLLEGVGPVLITYADIPFAALAEAGCFCIQDAGPATTYRSVLSTRTFIKRPAVSDEAVQAYILALHAQDGADATFHRLYRIFELEFAASMHSDLASTPITDLYRKLKNLRFSEKVALEATVKKSNSAFTRFSLADFDALFGVPHEPPETYPKLKAWLSKRNSTNPSIECRADVLYYVRNALIHSKVTDGDVFLLGPYEGARKAALENLVADVLDLVRDLIAL